MLPKHLVFELHYLGGTEESYTLNFSRPGAQIIAQYYNLIHLGFSGFRDVSCRLSYRVSQFQKLMISTDHGECHGKCKAFVERA